MKNERCELKSCVGIIAENERLVSHAIETKAINHFIPTTINEKVSKQNIDIIAAAIATKHGIFQSFPDLEQFYSF